MEQGRRGLVSTFVLVHGGCHGAWCWHKTVPLLEAAGHRVLTPDLPGHGVDRTPIKGLTQHDYAAAVESVLRALDEPVVLVGHSLGGMTVALAAERCPERIETLVYVTGTVLGEGHSMMTDPAVSQLFNDLGPLLVNDEPNHAIIVPPEAATLLFYHDCNPADIALGLRLLTPEPWGAFATPIELTAERYGRVRRVGLLTRYDQLNRPEIQASTYATGNVSEVFTLPTGHSPMLAAPELFAERLLAIAGG
ncbi:alpha/beta fold hydrolase [Nocardia sp. NPDC052278]|uniref:alpha/beta fold hydrolase n=1 Tax=unclassified Nocardia TaxID=2637762 RepID=UPI0036782D99